MTTNALIAELEVRLAEAKRMRKFSFSKWGESSAYEEWDQDVTLYTNVIAELKAHKLCKQVSNPTTSSPSQELTGSTSGQ